MPKNFDAIKEYVIGKRYDLSVAFLSPAQMKKAMVYKKPKPKNSDKLASNVLAFPLSPKSGEILMCKSTANKQAATYSMSRETFIVFLFIHGLLHLKGYAHSATMEHEERRIMKKFGLRGRE